VDNVGLGRGVVEAGPARERAPQRARAPARDARRGRGALGRRAEVRGAALVVRAPAAPVPPIPDVRAHLRFSGQRPLWHFVLRRSEVTSWCGWTLSQARRQQPARGARVAVGNGTLSLRLATGRDGRRRPRGDRVAAAIEVGRKAPAFSLQDQVGRTHRLKDYAGRALVLYFYPKDDTPGCTREACAFRDRLPDLGKAKVAVLGVSVLDS